MCTRLTFKSQGFSFVCTLNAKYLRKFHVSVSAKQHILQYYVPVRILSIAYINVFILYNVRGAAGLYHGLYSRVTHWAKWQFPASDDKSVYLFVIILESTVWNVLETELRMLLDFVRFKCPSVTP